jgi:ABC-2 type transport system ATP-binding protein
MDVITIRNLSRYFKILNRHEGLRGAARDLFSKDYRIIKAVDDISLSITEGESVGFLGPNGAGKSTTIKMMTGVLEPTGGEILVNGNIPFKNRQKNAQNIGVVFGQRTQLWWELPIIESFKVLKEIYRVDTRTYEENLGIFNELVDLHPLYKIPARNLSLGQRMLCDIVASFLHNPKIIFLDEPTIGLDISVKSKIRAIIKELNIQRKVTVILTTHDISDIEALCKRIIIIDHGRIIYDGSIARVQHLFGSYRTLKLSLSEQITDFTTKLHVGLPLPTPILVEEMEDGWIHLTINQDEIKLLDVMHFAMKEFPVKDVQIEEIRTENVIKKIYEGALQ